MLLYRNLIKQEVLWNLMEVSETKFIQGENFLGTKITIPITYFLLTSKEQKLYDSFRNKHADLAKTIDTLPNKGIEGDIRQKGERAISSMFLNLVTPYFLGQSQDLKPLSSFTYYGEKRETHLEMPTFILSDERGLNQKDLSLYFWFSTQGETLSCKSNFCYPARNSHGGESYSEKAVFYDILKRAIEKKTQDGIIFPIISFSGDFIYFASTDFTLQLMSFFKNILNKVGSERMDELKILYRSYMEEAVRERDHGWKDAKIKKEVFEKAYASALEITLLESGPF